jgi:hypothetical protein
MSDEPTITQVEGVKTTLPAEQIADLVPKAPEPTPEPATPEEGKQPEAKPEEPTPEVKPQDQPEVKEPEAPRKAKPIAKLLEKAHQAETEATTAKAKVAELEAKLAQVAAAPASPQATADIKALAEKHGVTPEILADIVSLARQGFEAPKLPKEVFEVIEARKQEQEQQAEVQAFDTRLKRLETVFKDEPIGKNRDKLLELAYSTEKAPDGEPYYQKELSELYFAYIKPEIEAGKKSAEPSRGGTAASTPVLDFAEIANDPVAIEQMDDATFTKFSTWMQEHQKGSPLRRA